jgi:hypothetical protein
MANKGKFRRGINVVAPCRCCGVLTHSSIDGCIDICLCRVCFESSGQHNAHSDGAHANDEDCRNNGCPIVEGLRCLHERNPVNISMEPKSSAPFA